MKAVSKAVNLDRINNQACRLSQNINVITKFSIKNNYLFWNDKENHFYQLFFWIYMPSRHKIQALKSIFLEAIHREVSYTRMKNTCHDEEPERWGLISSTLSTRRTGLTQRSYQQIDQHRNRNHGGGKPKKWLFKTRIPRNAMSRLPALFHKIEVNLWTWCSSLYHSWETTA